MLTERKVKDTDFWVGKVIARQKFESLPLKARRQSLKFDIVLFDLLQDPLKSSLGISPPGKQEQATCEQDVFKHVKLFLAKTKFDAQVGARNRKEKPSRNLA